MKSDASRNLVLAAICVAALGGSVSVVTGTWREGGLGLSVGIAVILLGASRLARGGDKAMGWVLVFVGSLTVVGDGFALLFDPA